MFGILQAIISFSQSEENDDHLKTIIAGEHIFSFITRGKNIKNKKQFIKNKIYKIYKKI